MLGDRRPSGLERFDSPERQLVGVGDSGLDNAASTGAFPNDDWFMDSSSESRPPSLVAKSLFRWCCFLVTKLRVFFAIP